MFRISTTDISSSQIATASTVYPKKYAHGFCFAVLCCGYTLADFPISIRLTSLTLWQSNDCPSASKATLMNMDKYFMWIHYERLHNHNKAKHNKTVCIFLGIYCTQSQWVNAMPLFESIPSKKSDAIGHHWVTMSLFLIWNVCYYHTHHHHHHHHFNEVERVVYWYQLVCLSICPSVDRIVSALYLQQYLLDPFHIYTAYRATWEGVWCVTFFSKIKKLENLANALHLYFNFVFFWLGIQH